VTPLLSALADALEAAADHGERQCACAYHHAPECPVAAWRALVAQARAECAEADPVRMHSAWVEWLAVRESGSGHAGETAVQEQTHLGTVNLGHSSSVHHLREQRPPTDAPLLTEGAARSAGG